MILKLIGLISFKMSLNSGNVMVLYTNIHSIYVIIYIVHRNYIHMWHMCWTFGFLFNFWFSCRSIWHTFGFSRQQPWPEAFSSGFLRPRAARQGIFLDDFRRVLWEDDSWVYGKFLWKKRLVDGKVASNITIYRLMTYYIYGGILLMILFSNYTDFFFS